MRKKHTSASSLQWRAALRRIVYGFVFFILAVIAVASVLSKLNVKLILEAAIAFWGWPRLVESLVVVATLIIIGLIARGIQFYQDYQNRVQQGNVSIGVMGAILLTIVTPLGAMLTLLHRIVDLLEMIAKAFASVGPSKPQFSLSSSRKITPLPASPLADDSGEMAITVATSSSDIFIGRERDLSWLTHRLLTHTYEQDTTFIYGISGIGKSALVTRAIERIQSVRFQDAVVQIPCGGYKSHPAVLYAVLAAVDSKRTLAPDLSVEVLKHASEQLLHDKERLLILDGVQPGVLLGEVVRVLRTKHHMAHILVTTSSAPTADVAPADRVRHLESLRVEYAQDGTEIDQALELFAQYSGLNTSSDFGEYRPYAVSIVESLERHTYSLQLIGAYVQNQLHILRGVAKEIEDFTSGSDTRGVTPGIEGVLTPVFYALDTAFRALSVDAQRLLVGFVVAFAHGEAGRRATRYVSDALGIYDKDGAIHMLLMRQLMDSSLKATMPVGSDHHRLHIHSLLLGYIRHVVDQQDWSTEVELARNGAATFYARYMLKYGGRDPERTYQKALELDARNISRSLEWAVDHNQHQEVSSIAHGMRRYWHDLWLSGQSERFLTTAKESARLLADEARRQRNSAEEKLQRERAADMSFTLARVFRRTGRLRNAEPLFKLDLAYRKGQGQYAEEAEALHQLAQLERSRGRMGEGLRYCQMGLDVVNRHLPRNSQRITKEHEPLLQVKGLLLAQQGRIERSRGNLQHAKRLFEQAYELFLKSHDGLEQGVALGYLGRIARVLGNLDEAREYFERSKELARQVNDVRGLGVIETQFGRIKRMQGDLKGAKAAFEKGLSLAQQVSDRTAEAVNRNYLGRIANSEGDSVEAEIQFGKSLEISRDIEDRLEQGVNLHYLGRIARQRGLFKQARRRLNSSLKILRDVEDARGEALVLGQIALIDIAQRHYLRARWRLNRSLRLITKVGDRRSEGAVSMYLGQLDVATRNYRAAQSHFKLALTRAIEVEDVSGQREAQEELDKLPARYGGVERESL